MAKKPKEDAGSRSADRPIRSVLIKTSPSDSPISRVQEEKTKVPFSSNQIRLVGRQDGRIVIRTSCFVSANQKPSEHPFGRSQKQDLRINQSHPSDGLSSRPITSFGRIILQTDFRLDQSHHLVGSSFGRTFVSTNHILWTDHASDGLSSRPITSFGWVILRTDFSYRPIRSLRRLLNR